MLSEMFLVLSRIFQRLLCFSSFQNLPVLSRMCQCLLFCLFVVVVGVFCWVFVGVLVGCLVFGFFKNAFVLFLFAFVFVFSILVLFPDGVYMGLYVVCDKCQSNFEGMDATSPLLNALFLKNLTLVILMKERSDHTFQTSKNWMI